MRGNAIVLGAGVIGLTTAWALVESGWRVQIVDGRGVGRGASLQNGGQLSYQYVAPLADAGVPLKALRWMLQRDGPLRWRPQLDIAQWSWISQFLSLCNTRTNQETSKQLALLAEHSRQILHQWMRDNEFADFSWEQPGKLVIFRESASWKKAISRCNSTQSLWGPEECISREPALKSCASSIKGGIFTSDEAVADCFAFCNSLLVKLESHPRFEGVEIDTIQQITRSSRSLALRGNHAQYGGDAVVLAAGIHSRVLAEQLGVVLPIYPLKGYSLDVPFGNLHYPPKSSITDFDQKILYARVNKRLRVAAMVDLVGASEQIDRGRLNSLMRAAKRDLPFAGDYEKATPWAGLRPATPSGRPIVGLSRLDGLWLNVGHGALGFTLACGSADLLARMMGNQTLPDAIQGNFFSNSF